MCFRVNSAILWMSFKTGWQKLGPLIFLLNSKKELSKISRTTPQKLMKICVNLRQGNSNNIMKDFTAKEQIFLLERMIWNLWLFLQRTSLYLQKYLQNIFFVRFCTILKFLLSRGFHISDSFNTILIITYSAGYNFSPSSGIPGTNFSPTLNFLKNENKKKIWQCKILV